MVDRGFGVERADLATVMWLPGLYCIWFPRPHWDEKRGKLAIRPADVFLFPRATCGLYFFHILVWRILLSCISVVYLWCTFVMSTWCEFVVCLCVQYSHVPSVLIWTCGVYFIHTFPLIIYLPMYLPIYPPSNLPTYQPITQSITLSSYLPTYLPP